MLNLNPIQPKPNTVTLNRPEIQEELLNLETREFYSKIPDIIQPFVNSYLPNPTVTIMPAPHFAAMKGSVEQLSKLEHLANVRTVEKGLTPLHYALAFQQKEAIRYLIEKTDLSRLTNAGNTYLHYAALTGDPEILELFLNRGIDSTLRNNDSFTAAHLWAYTSTDFAGLEKLLPSNEPEMEEPFSPLKLMAINAMKADNLLTESEWNLLWTNLADLCVVGLSLLLSRAEIRNFATERLETLHIGLLLAKSRSIENLSTPKLKETTNFDTNWHHRFHYIPKWLPYPGFLWDVRFPSTSSFVLSVQSGVSAIAVAWNAVQQIPKLTEVSWKSKILSSSVRLVNTACTTLDTYLNVGYPHYFACPAVPVDEIPNTVKGRLTHLQLTKYLWLSEEDRAKLPNPEVCEENYARILDPTNSKVECSPEFKGAYKKEYSYFKNNPLNNYEAMSNLQALGAFTCFRKAPPSYMDILKPYFNY